MEISGLPRGFSTCCLRFKSDVATTLQSSLRAGWLAFSGRELNPLDRYKRFQIKFSFSFSGFILTQEGPLLHLPYSCASPVLMAMLVTHDPELTWVGPAGADTV